MRDKFLTFMEWILFILLLCFSVPVNAADHDPTASRDTPSNSSVSVNMGNSQTFTVNVQDLDGDLNYVEWYVGGLYKESDSVSGSSNRSTFSHTFTGIGTFEVRAIVFDSRNNGSHVGAIIWNVTVSLPPNSLQVINFSGYTWIVKDSGDSPKGPGPNYWLNSNESIWVDAEGQLHLKITNRNGKWYCSEVYSNKTFGYGEYIFFVATRVDFLDKNVVEGLFTYKYNGENITPKEYEIDVEFSTWNNTILPNKALHVFQYRTADNDSNKITPRYFNISLIGNCSTHKFIWNDDYLHFQSYHGHYDNLPSPDYLIANTTFDKSNIPSGADIPPESEENVRINLWLIKGQPPSDEQEVEIIIKKFIYKPCKENLTKKCYSGAVYYYGSCGDREKIYDNCSSKPTSCGNESCSANQKPSWSCSGESCSYTCVSSSDCTCETKYLEDYLCDGSRIQQKYQNSDCSKIWKDKEYCKYGCNDNNYNCKSFLDWIVDRLVDFFSGRW